MSDAYNHALHTANIWLADIGSAFGTRDRRYSQRVLRTWLHVLRDRLTISAATKFGQQLPELLRGGYYDGWDPNRVPIKYNVDQYIQRFATEASIPPSQVPATAATITQVIADRMSPGQLAETLAEFPTDLRATLLGSTHARLEEAAPQPSTPAGGRQATLEEQVNALTEAVRALAHGLENGGITGSGIDQTHVSRAARLAEEILIGAK